jgi:hypothetical protein
VGVQVPSRASQYLQGFQQFWKSCFIALVIVRLLEKKLNYAFPLTQLIETMGKISCSFEEQNLYLFDYRNPVCDALGKAIGCDFTKKRLSLAQIKNILANCKNP